MDLLRILAQRMDSLLPGEHSPGLRAVLQHVQVAVNHLTRGTEQADDTAFTDAIYRTNQAFEGSLKEAYRVLTGNDPHKVRPFDIENYFQEHALLRGRVLAEFSNYRKEWRNPSTHDYRLDFDEDEALLAIVSVCAFAIVLIDQVSEKLSFEAAKAATKSAENVPQEPTKPIVDLVSDALLRFRLEPVSHKPQDFVREAEIVGAIAGYLESIIPSLRHDLEPHFQNAEIVARPDLVVTRGAERLIVEVKRAGSAIPGVLRQQYIAQGARYLAASGLRNAIIYVYSEDLSLESVREDHVLQGSGATVTLLLPRTTSPAAQPSDER